MATKLVNPQIAGLTGDGSALLVLLGAPVATRLSMWLLPLPAGEARRLGDTDVTGASLFPDGRVLYTIGSQVYLADKDGSNPRKLDEISKHAFAPNVSPTSSPEISPDGKRFAFSVFDGGLHIGIIHEGASDGTGLHQILKGGEGDLPAEICCPKWSGDGTRLIFRGQTEGRWDIWALPNEKRFLGGASKPVRLTNGPVSYSSFVASRDGKKMFAVGSQRRGELVSWNRRSREFVPYLGGISALDPTFSRDGKWVAYLSYPEHTLWRSRVDGSDRLQLTYGPQVIIYPRISPDGTKVAFSDNDGAAYVISINGGSPKKLSDNAVAPDWSPDGNLVVVSSNIRGGDSGDGEYFRSRILDVRTASISNVPDSQDTLGPWFANQDTLIATSEGQSKFVLLDLKTGKKSELIANPDRFVNWEVSPDDKYLFYSIGGNNPRIFRLRLADHAVEEVANLKEFRAIDDPYVGSGQLSVNPDNDAVITRDIGTQEVYAISVKWP